MRGIVLPLVSGLLFAAGLALGGMTDPAKVAAFLDVTGAWDPALALVMGGAIGVYAPLRLLLRRKQGALHAATPSEPVGEKLGAPVLLGAAIFGVGWGLAGYCPGPALASLGTGNLEALTFVAAMVTGIGGFRLAERFVLARPTPQSESNGLVA